jgi:hypothetical protein
MGGEDERQEEGGLMDIAERVESCELGLKKRLGVGGLKRIKE